MDSVTLIALTGVLLIAIIATVGGIAALLKQKVVVDQSGNVTAIEIPRLGKFTTNYPSLVAVVIGALLGFVVIYKITIVPDSMTISANIDVEPADVKSKPQIFIGVIPQEYHLVKNNVTPGAVTTIPITVRKANNYHVITYTVVGTDPNGKAIIAEDDGAVDGDGKFSGNLRLK